MTGSTPSLTLPGVTKWCRVHVVVAALVLAAAVAGTVTADEGKRLVLGETARNGLVAYSYAGDIYVGDPATGETTAIATNPAYEVNPAFSPNGRRIAFIRGNPQTAGAKVVVVRADGSNQRLIFPKGRKHRGLGNFGWTPNGSSLVVELDTPPFSYPYGDGELSLFDSSGNGKERLLTPPLVQAIGAHYWGHDQVAPMFRPPSGDLILSGDFNDIRAFRRDLTTATPLNAALTKYKPYIAGGGTWSPDGTRILFDLLLWTGGRPPLGTVREGGGLFVMSAEGKHPRRIGDGAFSQWSPDGSKIAFERVRAKTDRAILVVLDLKTRKERLLESTSAVGKDAGAKFSTITYNNVVHHWFYEGWTWAPDSRSLLVLENHRTRPWVVDIERDTITKLPWLADSLPSWQPVRRR